MIVEFHEGDVSIGDALLGASVTYEFQSLDYDNCTRTRVLAESDSDLYTFSSFTVLEQVTDDGVY